MEKTKKEKTSYNIRIVDNGDGTFELGFVSRFKTKGRYSKKTEITVPVPKDCYGEWVEGSVRKMVKLLRKGNFIATKDQNKEGIW